MYGANRKSTHDKLFSKIRIHFYRRKNNIKYKQLFAFTKLFFQPPSIKLLILIKRIF